MPNGNSDRETVQIQVGGKSYNIDAPKGLSDHELITRAIMADPEFAQTAAQAQSMSRFKNAPMKYSNPITGREQTVNPKSGVAPSELTGMNTSPEEDASIAGGTALGLGVATNPVGTARGLGEAALGAYGGKFVGGGLGGLISPTGRKWGERAGALAGAFAGPAAFEGGLGLRGRMLSRLFGRAADTGGAGAVGTMEEGSTAAMPDTIRAPINSRSINVPETNAQNIPRSALPGMIQRTGDPGAVKEAQRLGSTVLYVPEEGYSGARMQGTLADRIGTSAEPQVRGGGGGNGGASMRTGEGTSAAHLTTQAPKTNLSQRMMSEAAERTRLQGILDNPNATEEERNYAKTVLGGGNLGGGSQ